MEMEEEKKQKQFFLVPYERDLVITLEKSSSLLD